MTTASFPGRALVWEHLMGIWLLIALPDLRALRWCFCRAGRWQSLRERSCPRPPLCEQGEAEVLCRELARL